MCPKTTEKYFQQIFEFGYVQVGAIVSVLLRTAVSPMER